MQLEDYFIFLTPNDLRLKIRELALKQFCMTYLSQPHSFK